MSFHVSADAYDRFMGRFSGPLADQFAAFLHLAPGHRALDVGCGPGALTAVLAGELGPESVGAIDPSEPFVAALRERLPGVDARSGAAEALPWPDGSFDRAASQLVVQFMADPDRGIAEMARVTRPGGMVAATVWDFDGGTSPLSPFWQGAKQVDPAAPGEAGRPGSREGDLAARLARAGLAEVEPAVFTVALPFASFEEWWDPFTLGVGTAGSYLATVDHERQAAIRAACARLLPPAPFTLTVRSWAARAVVPG